MTAENPSDPLLRRVPPSRFLVFAALASVGAIADLWTKQAVFAWRGLPGERDVWWLVDGYVGIETAVNIGAVFGIGAGQGTFFAIFSVIAAIGILIWLFHFGAAHQWWLTVALACVTGGIVGNLYDRLGLWWQPGYPEAWKSGVRDWILFQAGPGWKWPNFNIADSLLVCGAGMLMWHSFRQPTDATEAETKSESDETATKLSSFEKPTPETSPR